VSETTRREPGLTYADAGVDIAAGEQVDKALTSTPILTAAQNSSFVKNVRSLGTDQVTVPLGTFSCTKYLQESRDTNMTYWIASGVPLPIKMVTTDRVTGRDTMTMELVSYS
jgi:type IV secretory pathway TrbF-like protein